MSSAYLSHIYYYYYFFLITFKIDTPVPLEKRLVFGPRAEAEISVEVVRGIDDVFWAQVMAKEGNSAKGHNVHSTNIYLLLYFSSTPPQSPVALTIREQMTRMKTKHEIWCNGSGDMQPLLD